MSYEGISNIELGKSAYRSGHGIETNPFIDGSQESRDFSKGWKKEHKDCTAAARAGVSYARRNFRNEFNS